MLRVGISGIGFMGMIHYLAYQQMPEVKVTAICEKIPERLTGDWTGIKGNFGPAGTQMDLTGVATFTDQNEMFASPEVDMVDVCLPPNGHCAATVAALNAGKHVLCEKPIALKTNEADMMVAAAQKNGKMLMIGHVLPFFPSHAFVWEAAQTQKYGKLLGGHFNRVISDPTWLSHFYDMDICGGPMLDLHIHDAHFIRLLFGMPSAVQSVGRCRGNVPEYFSSQFLFDDAPSRVVTAVSGTIRQQGRPFTHGYEVHFEQATVLCESFMGMDVTVLTADGQVEKPVLPALGEIGAFVNELTEATTAIQSGQPSSLLDGKLAQDALRLCHKEIESILTGKRVTV